jgi:hypothetical protein
MSSETLPAIGATVATTVHSIGGRSERVSGTVVEHRYSRRRPGVVLSVLIDASAAGYGSLSVPLDKLERA